MKKLKKTKIFIFGKKSHNAEKKLKGGPFGIFQHPFCRKTSKKMQGDCYSYAISKENQNNRAVNTVLYVDHVANGRSHFSCEHSFCW